MKILFSLLLLFFSLSSNASFLYSIAGEPYAISAELSCRPYLEANNLTYDHVGSNATYDYICYYSPTNGIPGTITSGTCPSGYIDDGNNNCVVPPPPECEAGQPLADQFLVLPITHSFFKYGDCQVVVTGCEPASSVVKDGYDTTFALCHLATTDKPASEVDNPEMLPQPELPDNTCAAGQTSGTFNGSFICIDPQGKIAETNKPKVKTSGDVITKIDNGDGTYIKTTIKTIINNDGDKIIKTINEKFDDTTGEKLSEDTTEVDETPDNEFGDSGCAAIPVCVGDAIQCAIATQLHKQSCATAIPEGGMTADNLGISVEDQTMIVADDYSVGDDIDTSTFLADTCPTPRPVNLGKYGNFTVDYQPFCEIADIIGKLVIFTATIISIRIIGSS